MAITKVNIANRALIKIGADRISSFNEDAEEARIVNEVYDSIRDECLMEHIWSFAQKRAMLAQISTTISWDDDGMEYVYQKPSDFLKLNYVNSETAVVKVEEQGILCNEEGLGIIYTASVDNPSAYTPLFVSALICRLAAEMCFSISNAAHKSAALMEEYEKVWLPRAMSSDSQQGSPDGVIQDEWERARLSSSGSLVGRSGYATWHPVY